MSKQSIKDTAIIVGVTVVAGVTAAATSQLAANVRNLVDEQPNQSQVETIQTRNAL